MVRHRITVWTDDCGNPLSVGLATYDNYGEKLTELVHPTGPFDPAVDDLAAAAKLMLVGEQLHLFSPDG